MSPPRSPAGASHPLASGSAIDLMSAAADLSLLLGADGRIEDVRVSSQDLPLVDSKKWVGRPWLDTVTSESQIKVKEILKEAQNGKERRWRHINYPSSAGADVPILCSAVRLEDDGRVIAFGRDLRNMATLQQRLVEAHQAMERDYMRMRHMETRYRLLFELAAEAILIVDPQGQKILEANPSAGKILGMQTKRMIGKTFSECFDSKLQTPLQELLNGVRLSGEPGSILMAGQKPHLQIQVSASIFRQETGSLYLVRLTPTSIADETQSLPGQAAMLAVLEHSPDAFVVTDLSGKIITVNQAFVDMTQLTRADQVIGQPLDRWLGRSEVDLSVLIASLQQRGSVRLYATVLRATSGPEIAVELSGVSVQRDPLPCMGFAIRDIGPKAGAERPSLKQLPRSADQLIELVGRVPLQEIVSETADLIEKLCIEAALKLTRDNRASASEMLGLSRQSLYVKLRRYGIGEISERPKK